MARAELGFCQHVAHRAAALRERQAAPLAALAAACGTWVDWANHSAAVCGPTVVRALYNHSLPSTVLLPPENRCVSTFIVSTEQEWKQSLPLTTGGWRRSEIMAQLSAFIRKSRHVALAADDEFATKGKMELSPVRPTKSFVSDHSAQTDLPLT